MEEHSNTHRTPFLYNGKELDDETGLYYYGARYYDPVTSVFISIDPHLENYPGWTPYNYVANNPINIIDPDGRDWYDIDGYIQWKDHDGDLTIGDETYKSLGKNVLVGTHNRDSDLNEDINSARFDLYLESNTEGPSATIYGNTIPADTEVYGTVKEGIYDAKYSIYKGDGALLLEGGGAMPTVKGNPNNKRNYNSDGTLKPTEEHVITEVFFHKGNFARESLSTQAGNPISAGCQTGGSGQGSLEKYRAFIKHAEGFDGKYYLRKPVRRPRYSPNTN